MTKFLCDNPIPFYVYKVTLRPTGQYYFGFRKRHVTEKRLPENDLWLHYFTSSNEIAELLKGYSANQFDAQIVHKGFDLDGCFWIEQELIKQHFDDSLSCSIKLITIRSWDIEFLSVLKSNVPSVKKQLTEGILTDTKRAVGQTQIE
jgi:hypothetical protein